jgi:hypothetical protein
LRELAGRLVDRRNTVELGEVFVTAHWPDGQSEELQTWAVPQSKLTNYQRRQESGEFLVGVRSSDSEAADRAVRIFVEAGGQRG